MHFLSGLINNPNLFLFNWHMGGEGGGGGGGCPKALNLQPRHRYFSFIGLHSFLFNREQYGYQATVRNAIESEYYRYNYETAHLNFTITGYKLKNFLVSVAVDVGMKCIIIGGGGGLIIVACVAGMEP